MFTYKTQLRNNLHLRRIMVIALAASLSACAAVGPQYEKPVLDLPVTMQGETSTKPLIAAKDLQQWWLRLEDGALSALLKEALENSQDLRLAAARIAEARASEQVAQAHRYPSLDANFSSSRHRLSTQVGKVANGAQVANNSFQIGLQASYEVDFWSKYKSADNAARARLLAQEANQGIVQSSLVSAVVQSYGNLRAVDEQIAVQQSLLKTRQEYVSLLEKRLAAGVANQAELNAAQAERAQMASSLEQWNLNRNNLESGLAFLLGRSPKEIATPNIPRGSSVESLVQRLQVVQELPSELLARRPDIIAAEANLQAANADVAQAKAAYFPSLRLTTNLGHESRKLADLFSPSALLWNVAASLTQPIFRAGAIDAVVDGANARKAQAQALYVQAVQGAFRDVHDALGNTQSFANQHKEASLRYRLSSDTRRLIDLRYKNGASAYVELLNAERDMLQTKLSLIENQRAHFASVVGLYKVLGGGWGA